MDPTHNEEGNEHSEGFTDSEGDELESASGDDTAPKESSQRGEEEMYIYNNKTGILHAATRADAETGDRHNMSEGGDVWSTLCRCELTKSVFRVTRDMPELAMPCRRKACLRSMEDNIRL